MKIATDSEKMTVLIPRHLDDKKTIQQSKASLEITTFRGETMGTYWTLKLQLPQKARSVDIKMMVLSRLNAINRQMSHWEPTSELSQFNKASPHTSSILSKEFFTVLKRAIEIARITDGIYSPTMAKLLALNGFGPNPNTTLTHERSQQDLASNAWQHIQLDSTNSSAQHGGNCQLDLSSIAKGYSLDFICEELEKRGVTNYLLEIGGEFKGNGCKPSGQPWWVELSTLEETKKIVLATCGVSLATSGTSVQHFQQNRKLYHHLIDTKTGLPTSHDLVTVSVIANQCVDADAWATALFLLGPEEGFKMATQQKLAAIFTIIKEGKTHNLTTYEYNLLSN